MNRNVFKILTLDEYRQLFPEGRAEPSAWAGTDFDLHDGFIHLSALAQVRNTANLFFKTHPSVKVLEIDWTKIQHQTRWECPDSGCSHESCGDPALDRPELVSGSRVYPHCYGPVELPTVVHAVHDYRQIDGVYPELL
ncbi:uncharacterized protein BJ171DRAFT_505043 [Polychytrium aggregatum]|uniref:uncharacterized protein n=1 Tax=Polychytrium aggregatum TaxID=110093 RepID=UPI0022FE4FE3|nr:uncharacterized protein BJ171DRAFT_505043 [Polychytrium aggregatum]KAI9204660.1 hypothetical protein BJ171DRAFT_505043 [Polychytrium aggregatum]